MARSKKKKSIKVSPKQYKRAVTFMLILIVAIFIWTTLHDANTPQSTDNQEIAEVENKSHTTIAAPKSSSAISSSNQSEFFLKTGGALEIPYYNSSTFIIENLEGRYTLLYDTAARSATWVAYVLTKKDVETPSVGRSTTFKSDPEVVRRGWPTAVTKDYTNTGYDRGHLLPSADRDDTREENNATFYLSNVAPQEPNLNRKVWKNLEEQVRDWALEYDSLYVVTGAIKGSQTAEINNGVDIPEAFYKGLMVKTAGEWYTHGYLMPNKSDVENDFELYALTIDELESRIGLDLFCNMNDSIENKIEATKNDNIFKR